jgi:hypothetical protein
LHRKIPEIEPGGQETFAARPECYDAAAFENGFSFCASPKLHACYGGKS